MVPLATVKFRKGMGWYVMTGTGEVLPGGYHAHGRDALIWGCSLGYQVGFRDRTYNDGGHETKYYRDLWNAGKLS